MLETATKAAATFEVDNYKKKKMSDKRVSLVDVDDEEKKSKKKNKSCKISDVSVDLCVAEETLALDRPKDDAVSRNGMGREELLRSIAAFLNGSGFSKTLSVFLLEAKIDVKSRGDSCINLENLFDKVIEPSRKDQISSIEWPKEQDVVDDSNPKAKDKKRKDKASSHSNEEGNVFKNYLDTSLRTAENIDYDSSLNVEKKKKRKVMLSENKGEQGSLDFEDVKEKIEELKELTSKSSFEMGQVVKNKSEKKKKKNANQSLMLSEMGVNQEFIVKKPCDNFVSGSHRESVILGGCIKGGEVCLNFEEIVKEKMEEQSSNPCIENDDIRKNKGEKKKKKKDANQFLEKFELGNNSDEVLIEKSSGGDFGYNKLQESVNSENKVKDLHVNVECSKKIKKNDKTKKLKKSSSDSLPTTNSCLLVDNMLNGLGKNDNDVLGNSGFINEGIAVSEENNGDVEKLTNKKRKRSLSNETAILVENINAANKSKLTKSDVSKNKKETEDHKVFTCSEPAPANAESKESIEAHSSIIVGNNPIYTEKHLHGHQLPNGNADKHQNEGSARTKSMKKEKRSGEPKVVNAFQRIKVEDVKFAHERLRDNSYWSMDASGTGYGAKAQEVLGRVRGRDFRHEKTKKKRGTYRGGQIDIQSCSFKFKDSDDE